MKATLIGESHGAGGSSADYQLDPPLKWRGSPVDKVRVSGHWGTLPIDTRVIALPSLDVITERGEWEACETILHDLGYTADPFPLRNNKYLSPSYRRERGWEQ